MKLLIGVVVYLLIGFILTKGVNDRNKETVTQRCLAEHFDSVFLHDQFSGQCQNWIRGSDEKSEY